MRKMHQTLLIFLLLCGMMSTSENIEAARGQHAPYTYNDLKDDLVLLKQKHPAEISYTSIGKSLYGRELYGIRIGKGKNTILISGSHHGREWMTTKLLMKMAFVYAGEQNPDLQGLLERVSIWMIPMVNPDGVSIQQHHFDEIPLTKRLAIWRMNRFSTDFIRWKANGRGVDLNRQYPAGWDTLKADSSHPAYQFYRGSFPLSEPESKALAAFANQEQPLISVAYHSTGEVIYWQYRTKGQQKKRDYKIAEAVAKQTGYSLAKPEPKATGAGFTDWFIQEFAKPAMTIEIGQLRENTEVPYTEFPDIWEANHKVGWLLLKEAEKLRGKE